MASNFLSVIQNFLHELRLRRLKPWSRQILTDVEGELSQLSKADHDTYEKATYIARMRMDGMGIAGLGYGTDHPFGDAFQWVPFQLLDESYRKGFYGTADFTEFLNWKVQPPIPAPVVTMAFKAVILEHAQSVHSVEEVRILESRINEFLAELRKSRMS